MNDMICVIIPVYNVEKYLPECLKSVLSQTCQNLQVVLIDDGSTDGSGRICDFYAEQDSRVYVIHQTNSGPGAARNRGLDLVQDDDKFEWVCFIDSDDWIHPQYLEILLNAAKGSGAQMSRCNYIETAEHLETTKINKPVPLVLPPEEAYLFSPGSASPWLKLFKTECFCGIRFPEHKFAEDMFTLYKVFFACEKVAIVDETLYYYRTNPISVSRSAWKPKCLDELEAFREQLAFFRKKDFASLHSKLLVLYLAAIAQQCQAVKISQLPAKQIRCYMRHLRQHMCTAIFCDRKLRKECVWCYAAAFPRLAKVYWTIQAAHQKIMPDR